MIFGSNSCTTIFQNVGYTFHINRFNGMHFDQRNTNTTFFQFVGCLLQAVQKYSIAKQSNIISFLLKHIDFSGNKWCIVFKKHRVTTTSQSNIHRSGNRSCRNSCLSGLVGIGRNKNSHVWDSA